MWKEHLVTQGGGHLLDGPRFIQKGTLEKDP